MPPDGRALELWPADAEMNEIRQSKRAQGATFYGRAVAVRLSGDRRWATRPTRVSSFSCSRRIGGSATARRPPSAAERSGRAPIDPSAGDSRSADVRDFPGRSGGRRRASSNRWTLPSADGSVGVARPLNRPKMAPADGSDRRPSPTLTPLVDRPADAFVSVGGHHVTPSTT